MALKRTDKNKTPDPKAAEMFLNAAAENKTEIKVMQKQELQQENTKRFTLKMPPDLHRQIKIRAATDGIDMNDLILAALRKTHYCSTN